MLDELTDLMGQAEGRCAYAEARRVHTRTEETSVRGQRPEDLSASETDGIGVRVRVSGGWGFAATHDISAAGAQGALDRALEIAAAAPPGPDAPLASATPDAPGGHWESRWEKDPFALPAQARLELLLEATRAMGDDNRLVHRWAGLTARRLTTAFANTDGVAHTQTTTECGAGIQAIAVADGELAVRSYPTAHGGGVAQAGFEHVEALAVASHAPRVAEEALALLSAPACPREVTTLVLHGEQVALQVHESIGHALELDRILLGEASYAGTSWVSPGDLGTLRYGSQELNITADATVPGGLGTFGWDDEGVTAARTVLISGGVLAAALSNRESAAAVGLAASGGCARADGFARQPIVRMTNVNLEPGSGGTVEDLIGGVERGIYMETNRSWSIDDRRLQFQFACELGREIRDGELGGLVRNPSYAGVTPEFWGSLDAVGSRECWQLWGLTNCGKGEPGQIMAVSHGAAPARFASVQVGVS